MNKKKLILFVVLTFFFGTLPVFAAYEGVSGNTQYKETDRKTNYIKMEFQDGNVLLFKLDSSLSSVVRQFKDYVAQGYYDSSTVQIPAPGSAVVHEGYQEEGESCSISRYTTPVYGDLVASSYEDGCDTSRFSIYLLERGDVKEPVIGHILEGSPLLSSVNGRSIQSIRFVEITSNQSQAVSGTESGSSDTNSEETPAITSYCSDTELLKAFKFLGRILSVVKIVIPLIIIIFGIIDFSRAVIASKDDEIKKSMKSLLLRAIAGVAIFFIPTLVNLVFQLIDDWSNYKTDYSVCSTCVTNPSKCKV